MIDLMEQGTDEWGVPLSMFGTIPEGFAAAMTRVVLLSSLVESKLHGLLSTVGAETQEVWAGRPAEAVMSELDRIVSAGMPARRSVSPELLAALGTEVSSVRADLRARNELVHSIWSRPAVADGVGWKSLPVKQRDAAQPARWTRAVGGDFSALIVGLVAHVSAIDELRHAAEAVERRRVL